MTATSEHEGRSASSASSRLQPVAGLARAAQVLGAAYALLCVGSAVVRLAEAGLVRRWVESGGAGRPPWGVLVVGRLVDVAGLAVVVALALWTHRVRQNAEEISAFRHQRAAVLAWLGWLVPVAHLWVPYQVLRDVHRASTAPDFTAPRVLDLAWGLWVTATVGGVLGGLFVRSGPDPVPAWWSVVAAAVSVAGVAVWVPVIRVTTEVQERRVRSVD